MRTINFYSIDLYNKKEGEKGPPPIPAKEENLRKLNDDKKDIYWTFNEFREWGQRKKEDLIKIHSLFCEVDEVEWEHLNNKLKTKPKPSLVIKTGRGFHLYWYLKEPIDCTKEPVAKADWFREFVRDRILPVVGADPQAVDACRLLRAPMFKYWKDKGVSNTVIDIFIDNEHSKYTVKELERYFPLLKKEEPYQHKAKIFPSDVSFWKKANELDTRYALEKLSGSSFVGGETFAFKKESSVTRIIISGKTSNAWIDENGRIGSMHNYRGIPVAGSIVNWLTFYGHDMLSLIHI